MQSLRRYFLFSTISILTAGCATDVANRIYTKDSLAPKPINEVQILWSKPNKPFTVLADFQSRGESPEDMRRKGAEIGADAVIVSLLGGLYSKDEQWAGKDRHSNTYARIAATAIKFN